MASDRRQYEKSVNKWDDLHERGAYSVEQSVGFVGVIVATFPFNSTFNLDEGLSAEKIAKLKDKRDHEVFKIEGSEICRRLGNKGIRSVLALDASADDTTDLIRDPMVSDLIFIGNGSISDLFIRGAKNNLFDWYRAAQASSHLKTGRITQRQCGIIRRRLPVPLGTFMASNVTEIRAAYDRFFNPKSLNDPVNNHLVQVFPTNEIPPYSELLKTEFDESDD